MHATTWSKYGSHAVVAVATWCASPTNVSLVVDWTALGLDEATAVASLPAITGVQTAVPKLPNGAAGPFTIPPDGGLLMLITKPDFAANRHGQSGDL